jgi:hypothetical protein
MPVRVATLSFLLACLGACTQVLGDFTEVSTSTSTSMQKETCSMCTARVEAPGGACDAQFTACDSMCQSYAGCVASCTDTDCATCDEKYGAGKDASDKLDACEREHCAICN